MTLPKEIRAVLELEEGDRVLLKVEPDGKVVLEKAIIVAASNKKEFRHYKDLTCLVRDSVHFDHER